MRRETSRPRSLLVLFAFLIGLIAPLVPLQVAPALAQPVGSCVVTTTVDHVSGSLREKIGDSSCPVITFAISSENPVIILDIDPATGDQLTINRNMTIRGPNADGTPVTVHGGGTDGNRVLHVTSGTIATIERLWITGGNGWKRNAVGDPLLFTSGGILNQGTLTVIESRIFGNVVQQDGGGIGNVGGTLSVVRSEISGNRAEGEDFWGGGIAIDGGTVTIINSTISGNRADFGGGIDVRSPSIEVPSSVVIRSSTIVDNTASTGSAISIVVGSVTSTASIVAGNTFTNACNTEVHTGGYNLGWGSSCFSTGGTDIINTFSTNSNELLLGTGLGFHGGPTQTYRPNPLTFPPGQSSSPAIDRIPADVCVSSGWPATDQRGVSRPQGSLCDIGAVERSSWDDGWSVTSIQDPTHAGNVTLRHAIAAAPIDATITFNIPGPGPHVIQLEDGPLVIDKNLTIQGPNLNDAPIEVRGKQGAAGFRVFEIASSVTGATLAGLTIANGDANGSDGGGIRNHGVLIVRNSIITGNVGDAGGGIYSSSQGMSVTIVDSLIAANEAVHDNGGGIGISGGLLTIISSTIADNTAADMGGGIFSGIAVMLITNSTITGNDADVGGGIRTAGSALTITSSTVVGNMKTGSMAVEAIESSLTTTVTVASTIVDGSCTSIVTSGGNNLFTDSSCGVEDDGIGDQLVAGSSALQLGQLGDFGGPTLTMMPQATSPAVGGVPGADCLEKDQRGRDRLSPCTIGAVEVLPDLIVRNTYNSGVDSLRWAIQNADPGGTIFFNMDDETYQDNLKIDDTYIIQLETFQILIDKSLTIQGPDEDVGFNIEVHGDPEAQFPERVFLIGSINSSAVVRISNLTITKGQEGTAGTPQGQHGGGVWNNAILTLEEVIVSGNSSGSSAGGGIYNNNKLTIRNSTIEQNTSLEIGGGGIYNTSTGTLVIEESVIQQNVVTFPEQPLSYNLGGGGILNLGDMTLLDSVVSMNEVTNGAGAGIYNSFATGPSDKSTIFNTTISGNTGATFGGGVYNDADLTIDSSTITGNQADEGGGAYTASIGLHVVNSTIAFNSATDGGAFHFESGNLIVVSSTIAGNIAGNSPALYATILDGTCSESITQGSDNLFGDSSCVDDDSVGSVEADLMLAPALALNNSKLATLTLMPQVDGETRSPAIDAVDCDTPDLPDVDQRGSPRPSGGACDIGAVEVQFATLALPPPPDDLVASTPEGGQFTFTPTASDWLGSTITISCAFDPDATSPQSPVGSFPATVYFPGGETEVTCSTTGAVEHDTSASFTVMVGMPWLPPTFDAPLPEDIEQNATSSDGATVVWVEPKARGNGNSTPVGVICADENGPVYPGVPEPQVPPTIFPIGTTKVTCTATDDVGQTTATSFDVTIFQPGEPTITVPTVPPVEATSADGAVVDYLAPSAKDGLETDIPVTCEPAWAVPGAVFPIGSTSITCSAEDEFEQEAHESFSITVVDTTPPALILPGNLNATSPSSLGLAMQFSVSATDLVDGDIDPSCNWGPGDLFPLGATNVICEVEDSRGNKAVDSFTVTIQPAQSLAPTFGATPGSVIPTSNPDGTAVTFAPNVSSEIDDNPTVVCTPPSGTFFNIGTHTITCTVTDKYGLSSSMSFQLTIVFDDGSSPTPPTPPVDPEPEEPGEPEEPTEPEAPVGDPSAFDDVWARTDLPVANGDVNRTWVWGPAPFSTLQEVPTELWEEYAESPDGKRLVRYYDKARMEITDPNAPDSDWFVTNGLLVVELITGQMQVGHDEFIERTPANVVIAGDLDDPQSPTYAGLADLLDPVESRVGETITERLNGESGPGWDVTYAYFDDVTGHNIAAPFWEFMNSSGLVWVDDNLSEDLLFENPFYGTGRPVTEAYWVTVNVGGTPHDVLLQCFERRCLTYTPENPDGWQVEAGNVGLHYFIWRYGE